MSKKEQVIRDALTKDVPVMDAAIKAFASYLVAGTVSGNSNTESLKKDHDHDHHKWSLTDVLMLSRMLSKHINQHTCSCAMTMEDLKKAATSEASHKKKADDADDDDLVLISEVTAQVWNELIASGQKPTKSLGKMALTVIWDDLDVKKSLLQRESDYADWNEKVGRYVDQFKNLLYAENTSDAHLIWDADGGKAELARRATARKDRAAKALILQQQQEEEESRLPFIEELPAENEESDD
jgi:hypothetical protein